MLWQRDDHLLLFFTARASCYFLSTARVFPCCYLRNDDVRELGEVQATSAPWLMSVGGALQASCRLGTRPSPTQHLHEADIHMGRGDTTHKVVVIDLLQISTRLLLPASPLPLSMSSPPPPLLAAAAADAAQAAAVALRPGPLCCALPPPLPPCPPPRPLEAPPHPAGGWPHRRQRPLTWPG